MMTDPIADMLTRIRNAVAVEAEVVDIPYSRMKAEVCRVLVEEGFLVQYQVVEEPPTSTLRVQLKYGPDGEKLIQTIRRISKPGRRLYVPARDLKPVLRGMGVSVISTSHGLMSNRQAKARNVGGEVLCEVY